MPTNETEPECPRLGSRWWVFLVTIVVIYIVGFLLLFVVYSLSWLLKRKTQTFWKSSPFGSKMVTFGKVFRDRMKQLISGDTIPGKILITIMLIFNLVFIAVTIHRSFPMFDTEECISISDPEVVIELLLVCMLFIYSVVRLLASNNILRYWINPYTIVDVCTLPHIIIVIILGVDWIGLRSLRFIWLTQITTVLQFTPLLRSQNTVDALNLVIYFLVLWLTSSGILHVIEAQGNFWDPDYEIEHHSVLLYVYLTMVTMSTVGYGDVFPVSTLGRAFMIVFIIGGLAFFAAILPKIVEITTTYYHKYQYATFDRTRVPKHVIVCGDVTAISAEDFLKDFLHPDRGDTQTHVLFLHPERPDKYLKNVLRSYYTRVQFLLGSVLNGNDLHKAHITTSSAIFILANKHAGNILEEDHANLLRVVSVKNTTDKIPVIIQLLHTFSKSQVENIEGWSPGRDIALCLNEMKLGLLAQSCLCPGFSTLIANLFYTSDFPIFSSFGRDDAWKEHYIKGASNEVYSSTFSHVFDGMSFHMAADICYNKLNLILLAVEHFEPDYRRYYVNPSQKYHPKLRIVSSNMLGYFIAQDQTHVSTVSVYCNCCNGNKHVRSATERMELKGKTSFMKRSVSMKRQSSPMYLTSSEVSGNGDMVIQFSPETTLPNQEIKMESVGSQSGSKSPHIFTETSMNQQVVNLTPHPEILKHEEEKVEEEVEEEERRKKDSGAITDRGFPGIDLRQFGIDHLHVCKPVRLEEKILNPDPLSIEASRPRPDIHDHIVLCLFADRNSPLLGLQSFLKPLRSKRLSKKSIKPVVVICSREFIEREWPIIRHIPELYVVEGSPLLWTNLNAANVMECSVCVVLTVLHTSTGHELAIDDKEAILCSLSIRKKLKNVDKKNKILVITDLRQESNVQFLDFGDEDTPDERIYKAQPFACGEAFSVSMFDSVTSSSFHGPGTLYLVEDLIHSSGTNTLCQVVSMPLMDTDFCGKTFGEFYNTQLKECIVCMGVSRKLSPSSNQRYVITSPAYDFILEESDVAFILTECSQ